VDDLIGGYHAVEPAEPVTELTCTCFALDRMGDHGPLTGAELKGAL
jgi:hypothetical protein